MVHMFLRHVKCYTHMSISQILTTADIPSETETHQIEIEGIHPDKNLESLTQYL